MTRKHLELHGLSVLADRPFLVKCSIINPIFYPFIRLVETSNYWSVVFLRFAFVISVFLCFLSVTIWVAHLLERA